MPCYNEEKTINKVVEALKKYLTEAVIYVYDNNSIDNISEIEIAEKAGAVVRYEYQQGKWNVIRRMFREIEAGLYIMVDGDDTYPADISQKMFEMIEEHNSDMIVGDCLSSTYFAENKRLFHNFGNSIVIWNIN